MLADKDLIAQAMANLVDNAVKYTPEGGAQVHIAARRGANSDIELVVTDSGPGIPAADRERAVERFVRLEQSRSQPGSGLGLSLAAAVAEAHSGRLVLGDGGGPQGPAGPFGDAHPAGCDAGRAGCLRGGPAKAPAR